MDKAIDKSRPRLGVSARLIHHNPILVCGAPRTATSWTAKALSLATNIRYIREPLSHGGYASGAKLEGFEYLVAEDHSPEYEAVWNKVLSLQPFFGRRWLMQHSGSVLHRVPIWPARLLIKEVNCPLALDWLSKHFPFQIVITIRHPCGYVASSLRLEGVGHEAISFERLIAQPRLMSLFSDDDQDWIKNLVDPIERSAAAFGIVYKILGEQLTRHPEWTLIFHKNMCEAPAEAFSRLYEAVGITPNRRLFDFLKQSSTSDDNDLYSLNRVTVDQPFKWKTDLTTAQIDRIAAVIARFRLPFYRDFA